MKQIVDYFKKAFPGASFFYSYLKYRLVLGIALSLFVGILDGLGLTMFLPLLQAVSGDAVVSPTELGKLQFVLTSMQGFGVPLTLSVVLLFMVIFFVLKGVFAFAQYYYRIILQESLVQRLRLFTLKRVNELAYQTFVNIESGRILNTLNGEVDRVSKAYQSFFLAVQCSIMVCVYIVFAFLVNAQFALLVSVGGAITNLLYRKIYVNTKGASRSLSDQTNDLQGMVAQHVTNFKYLKATHTLPVFSARIEKLTDRIKATNKRIGYLMSILVASREPLVIGVVATVIYMQINIFGSNLGPILVSLLFFYRALSFLMQLQTHSNHYLSVSGSVANVSEFQAFLIKHKQEGGRSVILSFGHSLELSNASVEYGAKTALKNINLMIIKNETVAFVGESGSGKTSLVNTLCGLLPVNGIYRIDGIDSSELRLTSLQERIGYITQEPVIFQDTVYNNVTLWSSKTKENVQKFNTALKKAAAFDFVQQLQEKEGFQLKENGLNLSGGQRQRISIARELFRDVDILILDEATSALDGETEKVIQENLNLLRGQYTVLIVAHRLATVRHADKIVVIKEGNIEAIGTFDELINESPLFNKMVKVQELV